MDQPTPPTLDYSRSGRPGKNAIIAHAICGAITTSVVTFAVGLLLIVGIASGSIGGMIGATIAIPLGLVYAGFVVALGKKLYRNPAHQGWALGIWIGLALAGLLAGGCFLLAITQ